MITLDLRRLYDHGPCSDEALEGLLQDVEIYRSLVVGLDQIAERTTAADLDGYAVVHSIPRVRRSAR